MMKLTILLLSITLLITSCIPSFGEPWSLELEQSDFVQLEKEIKANSLSIGNISKEIGFERYDYTKENVPVFVGGTGVVGKAWGYLYSINEVDTTSFALTKLNSTILHISWAKSIEYENWYKFAIN
jgi:hypothetical protein